MTMSSIANMPRGSLTIDDMMVKEIKLEEDKENDPFSVNQTKPRDIPITLQARTRHLSLVDTNRDGGRSVSVNELGGWTGEEDLIANKSRLGSVVVDSLQKHRRSWAKVADSIKAEDSVLSDDSTQHEVSLQGHDWNDLVANDVADDELDESVFPNRSRFLSVADSLIKQRSSSVKEEYSDAEAKFDNDKRTEFLLSPDVPSSVLDVANATCQYLPEDVVNIDEDGMTDYGSEIVSYLRKLQESFTLNEDFLDDSSVTRSMRSILVDWLVQVQHHLKLCQETLYLAVSMLDLVLNRRDVDPDKLQLVGITTLLVASKLEEYYPADIKKLLHLTEDSYTCREVLEMELVLIEVLDFQLYIPSPQVFLLRYTAASLHPADPTFLKTCQYLLDCHLPSPSHSCLPPSLLAAAAVLTSGLLYFINTSSISPFTSTVWTPTLIYYTSYSVDDLLVTSMSMLDMVLSSFYTGATTKYKSLSQHSRLVLQNHLQREVMVSAREALQGWASGKC
eukprot:GFUD01044560.1.p1 GENE.GFUD01044560.1~~GFUD01044560.1.p1  ORF type:complete len:506 (-),score=174.28 GFUD01044560.1:311-1828(-)